MIVLETPRLQLRQLVDADLDALFELYRDPEIRRYYPDGTRSYEETREELQRFTKGHPRHPELGLWATIHKPTQRFIGRCGLLPWNTERGFEVEVAYLLAKPYWGQGLGSEAAGALASYAFRTLGLSRVICMVHPENRASARVAQKIGMSFEGEFCDEDGPFLQYALQRGSPEQV